MSNEIVWNQRELDRIQRLAIDKVAVPAAHRIADACNSELADAPYDAKAGEHFMVSTEGSGKLTAGDYRATVIATTVYAKRHNAKHNTLVRNLSGGAE